MNMKCMDKTTKNLLNVDFSPVLEYAFISNKTYLGGSKKLYLRYCQLVTIQYPAATS